MLHMMNLERHSLFNHSATQIFCPLLFLSALASMSLSSFMCSCLLVLFLKDFFLEKKKQNTKHFCIASVVFHSMIYPDTQVNLIMVVVRFWYEEGLEMCRILPAHISAKFMFL